MERLTNVRSRGKAEPVIGISAESIQFLQR
jgi:hypothetical protein